MSALVVHVTFDVDADDVAAMKRAAISASVGTRMEPGCVLYEFSQALEDPSRFTLREVWRDVAALTAHFATAHMAEFRRALGPLRVERRDTRGYRVQSEFDPLALAAQSASSKR